MYHRAKERIMRIGTEGEDRKAGGLSWGFWTALPLIVLAIALAATNGHFNILDDEVTMLNAAETPAAETLRAFAVGVGQHEHPPLADLLLHGWWSIVPGSLFWLRLPFILCYVAAFAVLAVLTRRLAGSRAAIALAWLALFSPFGFHFGHLLGWSSVAFLLVAVLTYCYARWLEENALPWAGATCVVALALLYTNYFAWVLVGLLALDAALFRNRQRVRAWVESAIALLLLAGAFLPLWPALFYIHQHPQSRVEGSKLAAYIFDMYALLVSESFAPWFLAVGVPVALLCATCYILTLLGTRGLPRRLMTYFFLSTALLAFIGSINTKRLPFLMGWLFLPMAIALTRGEAPRLRRGLALSLGVVFLVGWFGTLRPNYYASTHFIDDWKDAVAVAMQEHGDRGAVVYDTVVAQYYLSRACRPSSGRYLSLDAHPECGMMSAHEWLDSGHAGQRVISVRGMQHALNREPADAYLDRNCSLKSERHFTRNSGAELKERLFPTQQEPEWRITVNLYDCP
jgi:dolichyl-phosphate-mannose-protein mannosyltransferase